MEFPTEEGSFLVDFDIEKEVKGCATSVASRMKITLKD